MKNKQNEVSQDGWKGEQNNTAQRLDKKHKKKFYFYFIWLSVQLLTVLVAWLQFSANA